jgi:hypothetical protein
MVVMGGLMTTEDGLRRRRLRGRRRAAGIELDRGFCLVGGLIWDQEIRCRGLNRKLTEGEGAEDLGQTEILALYR